MTDSVISKIIYKGKDMKVNELRIGNLCAKIPVVQGGWELV